MASSSDESEYVVDETITTLILTEMIPGLGIREKYEEWEEFHVRSANKMHQSGDADERITRNYFSQDCGLDEDNFKRRFRMSRVVFQKFLNDTSGREQFVQRFDAIKSEVCVTASAHD